MREKELEETAEGSTGQTELKRCGIKELRVSLPQLQLFPGKIGQYSQTAGSFSKNVRTGCKK